MLITKVKNHWISQLFVTESFSTIEKLPRRYSDKKKHIFIYVLLPKMYRMPVVSMVRRHMKKFHGKTNIKWMNEMNEKTSKISVGWKILLKKNKSLNANGETERSQTMSVCVCVCVPDIVLLNNWIKLQNLFIFQFNINIFVVCMVWQLKSYYYISQTVVSFTATIICTY